MVKGFVIGTVIFLVLVAGLLVYMATDHTPSSSGQQIQQPSSEVSAGGSVGSSLPETHTVEMSENGFSPKTLNIKKGDSVIFKNVGSKDIWPATGIHPTHTVYPGSDIKKCGTSQESGIFDACKGISPGSSWTFTFNEVGNWGYHDHLGQAFGTIVVS